MSFKPRPLAALSPTGCTVPPLLPAYQAMLSSAPLKEPGIPPRHANSHCASLGKSQIHPFGRWPSWLCCSVSRRQNSRACSQEIWDTGSSIPRTGLGLVSMNASHCRCVSSVSAMKNPEVNCTACCDSSTRRPSSWGGLPMTKRVAGTQRIATEPDLGNGANQRSPARPWEMIRST